MHVEIAAVCGDLNRLNRGGESMRNIDIAGLIQLAREAGGEIMRIYDADEISVETKADDSPLTNADVASHRAIVAGLAAMTPDIPVLSEESATLPWNVRRAWSRYWLIDPLDGTKEFVKRTHEFTVNIALIEDGYPTIGVVYAPAISTLYHGVAGGGAFKQRLDGAPEPIRVSDSLHRPVRVVGSKSHATESLRYFVDCVADGELVSMGSSLKFCLVAEGEADIYPRLGPTSEWDTAAAQCVVEQAGGQVTTLDLKRFRYNTKDSLLNPEFLVFSAVYPDWRRCLSI